MRFRLHTIIFYMFFYSTLSRGANEVGSIIDFYAGEQGVFYIKADEPNNILYFPNIKTVKVRQPSTSSNYSYYDVLLKTIKPDFSQIEVAKPSWVGKRFVPARLSAFRNCDLTDGTPGSLSLNSPYPKPSGRYFTGVSDTTICSIRVRVANEDSVAFEEIRNPIHKVFLLKLYDNSESKKIVWLDMVDDLQTWSGNNAINRDFAIFITGGALVKHYADLMTVMDNNKRHQLLSEAFLNLFKTDNHIDYTIKANPAGGFGTESDGRVLLLDTQL